MKEWNGNVPDWELVPKNPGEIKNWQDNAVEKSGIKVPDLELVREGEEQKEVKKEAKEFNPGTVAANEAAIKKSQEETEKINAIRAEFEEMGFQVEIPPTKETQGGSPMQDTPEERSPKKEFSTIGKASVFVKKMLRMELTPEEKKYHMARLTEDFEKLISEGAYTNAYKQYDEIFKEKGSHDAHCEGEMKDAMLKSVVTDDAKTFARLLKLNEKYGLALTPTFTKEELGLKEHEMVSPEVAQVAIDYFYQQLKSVAEGGMVDLMDWYENRSESWIESGIVSPEALSHAPGIKKVMQEDIMRTAKRMFSKKSTDWGNPIEKFEEYLNQVEKAGIFSKAEVWKWEEVQSIIHR